MFDIGKHEHPDLSKFAQLHVARNGEAHGFRVGHGFGIKVTWLSGHDRMLTEIGSPLVARQAIFKQESQRDNAWKVVAILNFDVDLSAANCGNRRCETLTSVHDNRPLVGGFDIGTEWRTTRMMRSRSGSLFRRLHIFISA